ncbi:MAG: hypothetical protein KA319_03885 [Ferruginibacter sp.]|nr:hypothetical protein [Ferruginibacter sp.]
MKILIENTELHFTRGNILQPNSTSWSAAINYLNYDEIDFEFDELLFYDKAKNIVEIDWELIKEFVKQSFEYVNEIQLKSAAVLRELHSQIFGKEHFDKNEAYFEVGGIKLKSFSKFNIDKNIYGVSARYIFELEVHNFLESKIGALMDPYYSYSSFFINRDDLLIMVGVSRDG